MMKRKVFLLILLCLLMAQPAWAETKPDMTIDNTKLVTNDKDATFIEGEVCKATGQTIKVRAGLFTVAQKMMPDTGCRESFRIKIPPEHISSRRLNVLTVIEKSGRAGATADKERVEISCVEKDPQKITTDKKEYDLTFPGYDTKIKARSSAEAKLTYTSDDPDVATVDENGNIKAKGNGETTVRISTLGNGQYKEAEKKVKVSVEAIDAYTVTYHSSSDEEESSMQIIETGESASLQKNPFSNGEHQFLGWARSDDGLVEYTDSQQVTDMGGAGDNIDLYAVWTGDGARAAVAWACMIANDDSFTYGQKPETSSMGCYFCGTNQRLKPSGFEKTYVCLTFVTAAYAHGAEDPEMMRDCSSGRDAVVCNDDNFYKYSCWKKIGYCSDMTIDDMLPGDVISWYNEDGYDNGHVAIYAGDNKIVDAEGIDACWSPDSIAVRPNEGNASLREAAAHHGRSYVMRYVGVNAGK